MIINACLMDGVSIGKQVQPCIETSVIGWQPNLLREDVRPNTKGVEKLLLYFAIVDLAQPQRVEVWQRLASLAERYPCGIRGMCALVTPLHALVTAHNSLIKRMQYSTYHTQSTGTCQVLL